MVIQQILEQKLQQAFAPEHLEIVNESHQHNVPAESESHFKLIIISPEFYGLRLLQRHRKINEVLAQELASSVHALAIHTYTPSEWQQKRGVIAQSPKCQGGEQ